MAGPNRRILRVEKELRQLIAGYLTTGLKEPLMGLASVTRVQVSPDLRHGKVFVSIIGDQANRDDDWSLLEEQLPEIQRHVGRQLKMKYTPKVQLILDTSAEYADKIERMLAEVQKTGRSLAVEEDGDED
ncbi:MAG: 30S ribosome-binding factor RbfA [Bdellovibrionaceae bacterium]|nr:30S ribosome-binding factor RbfA [Bdellovibrionales bacterium]MCB9082871.1 30S ribosome-binding factor RbfA [Pseudobdellovibrionaceae bacterium]